MRSDQMPRPFAPPHSEDTLAALSPLSARKLPPIQRYKPVYGENPLYKAHMTAIMEPDYYNGEWVRYSDHLKRVEALANLSARPGVGVVTVDMEDAAMRAYYDAISGDGSWEAALPTMPMHANATFRERIHIALKAALTKEPK